jgi:hypothetical protein
MSGLNQLFTQPEETGLKKEMETMYIRPLWLLLAEGNCQSIYRI